MLSRTLIKFSLLSKLTDWLKLNFKNHDDIIFIYHDIKVYKTGECQLYYSGGFTIVLMCAYVQAPVDQGAPIFLPKLFFYDGFLLMWCNLKILIIPKFPEHVCLTAYVGLPGLPPLGPK